MSADNISTSCGECGHGLNESPSLAVDQRQPCPKCGSLNRRVALYGSGSIAASGTAYLSVQTVAVGVAVERERAMPITPIKHGSLPTEVVAESMPIQINLLRPIGGQWAIDVGAFGHLGEMFVGKLDDAILAAGEWVHDLAEAWEERLKKKDGDE